MRFLKPADAAHYRSILVFAVYESEGNFGTEYRLEVMTPGSGERRVLRLAKTPRREVALQPIRKHVEHNGVTTMRVSDYRGTFALFNDWPEWDRLPTGVAKVREAARLTARRGSNAATPIR